MRWEAGNCIAAVLWSAASKVCSISKLDPCVVPIFVLNCFVKDRLVHLYSSTDKFTVWKNSSFILSMSLDTHMLDNLSIIVFTFLIRMLTLLSVDEILPPS